MEANTFSPDLMRSRREQKGLTSKELAYQVNLSPTTISSYERGRTRPSAEYWEHICSVLDIDVMSLPQSNVSDTLQEVQEQFKYEPVTFTFTEGQCYSIRNKGVGGAHNVCAWNVEDLAVLRYVGKHGIHHCFKDIHGGWGRTYTDAQLIGKKIKEVTP